MSISESPQQLIINTINTLSLRRYPETQNRTLQAWNAADELLLEHVNDYLLEQKNNDEVAYSKIKCLIINDQFGALCASLNSISPVYWSDSYLSQQAIKKNLDKNFKQNVEVNTINLSYSYNENSQITSNLTPKQQFDLVIIRIPKHNSLLEFQLKQIIPWLKPETKIIAGGMTKEIHKSNIKLFESILGTTTTSLAKKKARLIFAKYEHSAKSVSQFKQYILPEHNIITCGLPGVFSRENLDIGTQVLLKHLPKINENKNVIDLGCGNGVIGAIIAKKYPDAQVTLTDESYLAVESAKLTFTSNKLTNGTFVHTDVLDGIKINQFDYILCNPPFHQQNVQTLDIAKKMFKQSALCLKSSGELRVVANRHLSYLPLLKRYFSQVSSISQDKKFTVWLARKPLMK